MKVRRKQKVKAKAPSRYVSEAARLLREARAVIRLKRHWTQWRRARDRKDRPVCDVRSRSAVKWCAYGAVEKVGGDDAIFQVNHFLNGAAASLCGMAAVDLNNKTDHKTTLKMFTLAAKLAEQEDRAKRKSQLKEKGRDNHAK